MLYECLKLPPVFFSCCVHHCCSSLIITSHSQTATPHCETEALYPMCTLFSMQPMSCGSLVIDSPCAPPSLFTSRDADWSFRLSVWVVSTELALGCKQLREGPYLNFEVHWIEAHCTASAHPADRCQALWWSGMMWLEEPIGQAVICWAMLLTRRCWNSELNNNVLVQRHNRLLSSSCAAEFP